MRLSPVSLPQPRVARAHAADPAAPPPREAGHPASSALLAGAAFDPRIAWRTRRRGLRRPLSNRDAGADTSARRSGDSTEAARGLGSPVRNLFSNVGKFFTKRFLMALVLNDDGVQRAPATEAFILGYRRSPNVSRVEGMV
jgi:hypothetical protein